MTSWIKLGGKERPLSFGYEVGYDYETKTGESYNALVFEVLSDRERMAAALASGDMLAVAKAVRIKPFSDLVFYALMYEHRERGIEVDFKPGNVAGWVFNDMTALQQCMAALVGALGPADSDDSKKKPGSSQSEIISPASTGKNLSKRRQ